MYCVFHHISGHLQGKFCIGQFCWDKIPTFAGFFYGSPQLNELYNAEIMPKDVEDSENIFAKAFMKSVLEFRT